jgi:hypothetical protein
MKVTLSQEKVRGIFSFSTHQDAIVPGYFWISLGFSADEWLGGIG